MPAPEQEQSTTATRVMISRNLACSSWAGNKGAGAKEKEVPNDHRI